MNYMTNIKNKFGILGYGYVGKATHFSLLKNQPILIHDTSLGTSLADLSEAETIFICLPTSNEGDIEKLIGEIQNLKNQNSKSQFVLRSTVPLGTCDRIQQILKIKIIYIPEFLRERFWKEDCQRRPLIVGTDNLNIPDWLEFEEKILCSLEEAELIKMFSNNFATVKIAFANLFYDLSQTVGADYNTIKDAFFKVVHDQTYMEVPGYDGSRGFGGKCLPKDLDFFINSLDQNNLDSAWLKNIKELNKEWRKNSKDL